jgi:hypothetical protein
MPEPTDKPSTPPSGESGDPEHDDDRRDDPGSDPEPGGEADTESKDDARPPAQAALRADGMERPTFLLDFPQDDALEPLIRAFEAGNYAFVRERAQTVADQAADPAVRDAALELRRRIEPDPLAKYLLWIAIGLLCFLVVWTYFVREH